MTEYYLLALLRTDAKHFGGWVFFLWQKNCLHASKHVLEVTLKLVHVLAVADDIEEIFVADEVETREFTTLLLQIIGQGLKRKIPVIND